MNKTRAALLLAGTLAGAAAHAEATDEQKQARHLQRLQTELKLSDQQKQDIGKIFDETRPQLQALRKQMQELREKMRERMKAVLTAEQMEKFDKLRQERRMQKRQRSADEAQDD